MTPCPCGYNLRGRHVGDACPECGWVIDAPGPRWWTTQCLQRLSLMSRLAWIPCIALLAVPVSVIYGTFRVPGALPTTLVLLYILIPLQVCTQLVAVWRMAMPELGKARVRLLRILSVARACAIPVWMLGVIFALGNADAPNWEFELVALYLLLPLVAITSDFLTLRALISLRAESRIAVSSRNAVLSVLACGSLVVVYPMILVPYFGWFLAPIIWTIAMAIGFAQVGAVAQASRKFMQ
jgi:hypothetical protein